MEEVLHDKSRSKLGLDEPQSFGQKLWLTFCAVIFGFFITLFFMLTLHNVRWHPIWLAIAQILAEAFWVFLALVLVFIWYRPRWLRSLYLASESKVVLLVNLFAYSAIFVFFSSLLFFLVVWLLG